MNASCTVLAPSAIIQKSPSSSDCLFPEAPRPNFRLTLLWKFDHVLHVICCTLYLARRITMTAPMMSSVCIAHVSVLLTLYEQQYQTASSTLRSPCYRGHATLRNPKACKVLPQMDRHLAGVLRGVTVERLRYTMAVHNGLQELDSSLARLVPL